MILKLKYQHEIIKTTPTVSLKYLYDNQYDNNEHNNYTHSISMLCNKYFYFHNYIVPNKMFHR